MKNWLLLLTFIAYVKAPLQKEYVYTVQSFFARDGYYCLTLKNNKTVYVPIMFTVVEEK